MKDLFEIYRNDTTNRKFWLSKPMSFKNAEVLAEKWSDADYQPTEEECYPYCGDKPYKNGPSAIINIEIRIHAKPLKNEDEDAEETRAYEITSAPYLIREFERMLKFMAGCGSLGASRKFLVYFDGDGSGHLSIKRLGGTGVWLDSFENEVDEVLESEFIDQMMFDFE